MNNLKKNSLIWVEWLDAWASTEDNTKPLVHTTVGFVYRESKDEIVLAQSHYFAEDEKITNNFFGIPKGCIIKIKKLKEIDECS